MKSTHSFSIDFIIRKCKEETQEALIYARINVDGERKEISLKERIQAVDWLSGRQMLKGKNTEVKALNGYIDEVRFKLKSKYRMLQENNALITAETVKQAYLGEHTLQKGHKLIELVDYYKKVWEGKLKPGGFKNYKTTIDYIKLFLKSNCPAGDMYISQLSMETATDFEYYVRNTPIKDHDPCLGNGIAKHIQRFKRIINWAVEIGWLKANNFEKYSCPVKKNKRKKLTIQELIALENKQFQDERLNYIKDLFLYCCFTGLAFADVMTLNEGDFEQDLNGVIWCRKYRIKSDELSIVPILKSAAAILKKYRDDPDAKRRNTIFPVVSNQYMNKCLKIVKEACEINTPMTFHIARHTFAKTIALKNGVPLETVQMMMGHTKITTTQIYADVDEEKILHDMNGIDEKLFKKLHTTMAAKES